MADFGLSKLFPFSGSSHVTTRVMGTFGYLAPDYSITGMLTVKSDIYSFGVVLLELLSGKNVMFLNNTGVTEFLIPWVKCFSKSSWILPASVSFGMQVCFELFGILWRYFSSFDVISLLEHTSLSAYLV